MSGFVFSRGEGGEDSPCAGEGEEDEDPNESRSMGDWNGAVGDGSAGRGIEKVVVSKSAVAGGGEQPKNGRAWNVGNAQDDDDRRHVLTGESSRGDAAAAGVTEKDDLSGVGGGSGRFEAGGIFSTDGGCRRDNGWSSGFRRYKRSSITRSESEEQAALVGRGGGLGTESRGLGGPITKPEDLLRGRQSHLSRPLDASFSGASPPSAGTSCPLEARGDPSAFAGARGLHRDHPRLDRDAYTWGGAGYYGRISNGARAASASPSAIPYRRRIHTPLHVPLSGQNYRSGNGDVRGQHPIGVAPVVTPVEKRRASDVGFRVSSAPVGIFGGGWWGFVGRGAGANGDGKGREETTRGVASRVESFKGDIGTAGGGGDGNQRRVDGSEAGRSRTRLRRSSVDTGVGDRAGDVAGESRLKQENDGETPQVTEPLHQGKEGEALPGGEGRRRQPTQQELGLLPSSSLQRWKRTGDPEARLECDGFPREGWGELEGCWRTPLQGWRGGAGGKAYVDGDWTSPRLRYERLLSESVFSTFQHLQLRGGPLSQGARLTQFCAQERDRRVCADVKSSQGRPIAASLQMFGFCCFSA